jgi:hypothetical protein
MLAYDFKAAAPMLIKYVLEGLAVAIVAFYLTGRKTKVRDITAIAAAATATFFILDRFSPGVAAGTRQGAGFGVGFRMIA